jgi:hypothetical protein
MTRSAYKGETILQFRVLQYILRRVLFDGIFFVLSGMLLQRVADVGAGDMSLGNPASPFSNVLSTFCMMELSQEGMDML